MVHCYLEPEILVHSYFEHVKIGSQLFGLRKYWFTQLFEAPKHLFTTVWSKKKVVHCYLELEILVHSNFDYEKIGSQLF